MRTLVILFALMAMAAAQGSVHFVEEADNSPQDTGRRGNRPQPAAKAITVTNNGCGVIQIESNDNPGHTITVSPHDSQGSGSGVIQVESNQGCGNVMFVDNNNPGGVQFVDNSRPDDAQVDYINQHRPVVIQNPDPFFGQPSGPVGVDISPAWVDNRPYPYPYRPTDNGARSG